MADDDDEGFPGASGFHVGQRIKVEIDVMSAPNRFAAIGDDPKFFAIIRFDAEDRSQGIAGKVRCTLFEALDQM